MTENAECASGVSGGAPIDTLENSRHLAARVVSGLRQVDHLEIAHVVLHPHWSVPLPSAARRSHPMGGLPLGTVVVEVVDGRLDLFASTDLLVMGTIARVRVRGFLTGNTAEDVLNSERCSVVTVKPPG